MANESWSQLGEDLIVEHFLNKIRPSQTINYMEIGIHNPTHLSNTFKFYPRRGLGFLVEPNRDLHSEIKRIRPKDTLIPMAVVFDDRKHTTFYQFKASTLNSISEMQVDYILTHKPHGDEEIVKKTLVECIHINDLLKNSFQNEPIHFLSIDAEGIDEKLLRAINFDQFRPAIICAEANFGYIDLHNYMKSKNYQIASINHVNVIYLSNEYNLWS